MELIRKVRGFLHGKGPLFENESGESISRELQIAVAIVLLETAFGDEECTKDEYRELISALSYEFGFSKGEVKSLLEEANEERFSKLEITPFLKQLRENLSEPQRVEVLSLVWRVIDADGQIEAFEKAFAEWLVPSFNLSKDQGEAARLRALEYIKTPR